MTTFAAPDWAFRLAENLDDDLNEFRRRVQGFKSGELTETEFRAFRVPMGVYEQRESGTYMLRVRLPAGGILPEQMMRLANVSQEFGNGMLHVTTRQDIQVHHVSIDSIHPALALLRQAGLSTKGGGGNTVRNITSCMDSGVCPQELFDVAPFAVALTERFMDDRLSFQLPRKYKLAFSGCGSDCSGATVNDLGFIARQRNGVAGFAVYVGGGMGGKSRIADLLHEFVPADEAFLVAEAVKQVFDQNGDRKNRHLARLRFLIDRIGFEAFRNIYETQLAELRVASPAPLAVRAHPERDQPKQKLRTTEGVQQSSAYAAWLQSNVRPQKQPGFFVIALPLQLGDIAAKKLAALTRVVEGHGERALRATQSQNLALRWVSEEELSEVYKELAPLGLAEAQPTVLQNLVACAGASTCRLGICLSRGLARAITQGLKSSSLPLGKLGSLKVHISGCPNSCGRHAIADIGLHGAARRVEGRLVPHYTIQLAGLLNEGQTRFGRSAGAIPAKNVPGFVTDLLNGFLNSPEHPSFQRFMDNGGRKLVENLAGRYRQVPGFEHEPGFYIDWDASEPFSLAGRGPGECSAGVFDLIEVDLASSLEALRVGKLYAATILAARALLITKGEQPKTDTEALDLFRKHFVSENLVDHKLDTLVRTALRSSARLEPEREFDGPPADVVLLLKSVGALYENMDSSLRFKLVSKPETPAPAAESGPVATYDFRGVVCPLNYVKTKMALGKIRTGETLLVLLDEQGARNVPDSASKDGHTVVSVTPSGNHWQVLLRKV